MKQIQKGFTLIELMIVVAIIGILAAVAIPAYRQYVVASHGANAMRTVQGFVTKTQACIQTGLGCGTTLKTEMQNAGITFYPANSIPARDTAITFGYDGGLQTPKKPCAVQAQIDAFGAIKFAAGGTTGTGIVAEGGTSPRACIDGSGVGQMKNSTVWKR